MTNSTLKADIIALFVDNVNNDISAADMRTYVETIFDSKEEVITKIALWSDLSTSNTNIFEGSLVVIYNDVNSGLYLSTVNQPTLEAQLIKI